MTARRPLSVEWLEDRLTPATSGVTWPDAQHLTLSFAPDGTRVGDYRSNLFATLKSTGSTAAWQQAILKAFQAWAAPVNVNVGVVADGGQALGTTGAVQGDGRFGDIRVAAVPLPPDTLITNTAFQWSGTTWSGDLVVNSNYAFSLDGRAGTVDLYTAMLDEAGNVLGVLDSKTDPTSAVYYHYVGPKAGLTAADVADVRSLYGARSADQYDAAAANDTRAAATNLGIPLTGVNLQADITTPADVDWYKFSVPILTPGVIGLDVRLTTAGLSGLTGSVQVYNALGQMVGSGSVSDPLGGDVIVPIGGGGLLGSLLGGLGYSVQVAGAGGVGSYNLSVSYSLSDGSLLGPLLGGLLDPEAGLNDTLNSAVQLPSRLVGGSKPDARFDYTARSSISGRTDVDYYKVTAPAGAGQKMNVLVWPLASSGLLPRLDVYAADGTPVPSTLLANEGGTYSVEVGNVPSGGTYYVKVSALAPTGSHNTGNYFLGVDFTGQPTIAFQPYASGTLTPASPRAGKVLSVAQNRLYEFELAAAASAAAEVRMDVRDATGAVVFTLEAYAGMPASTGHVYLPAGNYTVTFAAAAPPGQSLPPVAFDLTGRQVSDPIGPRADTGSDTKSTDGWSGGAPSSKNTTATTWDDPYYA